MRNRVWQKRRWLRRASGESQAPFGADVQPQGRLFMMAFRAKGLMQRFLPRFLAKRTVLGKARKPGYFFRLGFGPSDD